jgi:hypothetical protein
MELIVAAATLYVAITARHMMMIVIDASVDFTVFPPLVATTAAVTPHDAAVGVSSEKRG